MIDGQLYQYPVLSGTLTVRPTIYENYEDLTSAEKAALIALLDDEEENNGT